MKFCKVRDVKSPNRANPGDAGIDMFVPDDFPGIRLRHGESALIPSGIKVDVPHGFCFMIENKSGVGSKKKLDRLACIVDCGYTGEVHISLINNGLNDQVIAPGDKIVQGILIPIGLHEPEEVSPDEMWKDVVGTRAEGGFGSTGD